MKGAGSYCVFVGDCKQRDKYTVWRSKFFGIINGAKLFRWMKNKDLEIGNVGPLSLTFCRSGCAIFPVCVCVCVLLSASFLPQLSLPLPLSSSVSHTHTHTKVN